jgi:hypothetical protein
MGERPCGNGKCAWSWMSGSGAIFGTTQERDEYYGSVEWAVGRWDQEGELLWSTTYYGRDVNAHDHPTAVVACPDQSVVVTGIVGNPHAGTDWATVRFGRDGTVVWAREFDGLAHADDWPSAVALDDAGRVWVVGRSATLGVASEWGKISVRGWLECYGATGERIFSHAIAGNAQGRGMATVAAFHSVKSGMLVGGTEGAWRAVAEDYDPFEGATQWFLDAYGPDGSRRWRVHAEGKEVTACAVLPDGRIVLAGTKVLGPGVDSGYCTGLRAAVRWLRPGE